MGLRLACLRPTQTSQFHTSLPRKKLRKTLLELSTNSSKNKKELKFRVERISWGFNPGPHNLYLLNLTSGLKKKNKKKKDFNILKINISERPGPGERDEEMIAKYRI